MKSTKEGFIWTNALGPCTGEQPALTCPWLSPSTFYMESMLVNLLADPIVGDQRLDLNCQVKHTNGKMIHVPAADRYQLSIGVSDIGVTRYFRTPWEFATGEGIVVIPYANGPAGHRWGILIHVEGFTL